MKEVLISKKVFGPSRAYWGQVEIKKNKRWCSVTWDIYSLDCLYELSDKFLKADMETHNEVFGIILKDWKSFPARFSRDSATSGALRWGNARGLNHEHALQLANRILEYWNKGIERWDKESTEKGVTLVT